MTILLFLAVLFVLILVHEWGHFIAAKKTGMRVDEFGIGFPPKLFSFKKGETEYSINLLPIGGFVRILGENGENGEEPFSPVASVASDRRSEASAEAGEGGTKSAHLQASAEAGEGGTKSASFTSKSKLAQAVVLVAGITMNIIFAWFLFVLVLMIGVPTAVDENSASSQADLVIVDIVSGGPADLSGLKAGTRVVEVSSGETTLSPITPTAFSQFVVSHPEQEISITTSEGEVIKMIPEVGLIESEIEKPAVGVQLSLVENISQPFFVALYDASIMTGKSLVAIVVGISKLAVDGLRGTADLSQVAGPVGIVGMVGDAAEFGFTSLLMFTAIISLNLAVINLLPLPALDGGRLLFVAIETVTRRNINPVWMMRVNFIGFALLILLMIIITISDVSKLF